MGDGTELFRMEALHAQTKHLIGEVVLYRPLSFAWLTLVSLVFAAAIIAFLVLASYTRKEEKMVSDPNLLPRDQARAAILEARKSLKVVP
ncbi:MAG: hypothetical protein ACK45Y_14345 [Betaproteobacteria bacterium]